MKTIMYLFSFVMLTSMTFKNNVSPGDPIPNVDVKLGTKPTGGIIATGVTDKNGIVEFKNLAAGTGYYLEFGIKEKGIKGSEKPILIEGIQLAFAATGSINTTSNRQPTVITKQVGDIEITVTVTGNMVRGIINVSRSNIKGPITLSRSNIKN